MSEAISALQLFILSRAKECGIEMVRDGNRYISKDALAIERTQVSPGTEPGNSGTDPLTREQ